MTTMNRRSLLLGGTALLGAGIVAYGLRGVAPAQAVEGNFEVTHTDAEWRALLSPDAYNVLRHEGTEYPGTSPLLNEHRAGTFGKSLERLRLDLPDTLTSNSSIRGDLVQGHPPTPG